MPASTPTPVASCPFAPPRRGGHPVTSVACGGIGALRTSRTTTLVRLHAGCVGRRDLGPPVHLRRTMPSFPARADKMSLSAETQRWHAPVGETFLPDVEPVVSVRRRGSRPAWCSNGAHIRDMSGPSSDRRRSGPPAPRSADRCGPRTLGIAPSWPASPTIEDGASRTSDTRCHRETPRSGCATPGISRIALARSCPHVDCGGSVKPNPLDAEHSCPHAAAMVEPCRP